MKSRATKYTCTLPDNHLSIQLLTDGNVRTNNGGHTVPEMGTLEDLLNYFIPSYTLLALPLGKELEHVVLSLSWLGKLPADWNYCYYILTNSYAHPPVTI